MVREASFWWTAGDEVDCASESSRLWKAYQASEAWGPVEVSQEAMAAVRVGMSEVERFERVAILKSWCEVGGVG